jgi:glycosyltransferase involved in cell wall biosynthesis
LKAHDERGKRLLFVVNVSWFFISHRLPIAIEAKKRGYDVHVASAVKGSLAAIEQAGLTFHEIGFNRSSVTLVSDVRVVVELFKLYRRLRPDLVHHVTSKPVLFGSLAARFAGVQRIVNAVPGLGIVFSSVGFMNRLRRNLLILLYRVCLPRKGTRVIFQNRENMEFFIQKKLCQLQQAVLIRGAGVDIDEFRFVGGSGDQEPTVVLASRMLFAKGIPEFVHAASSLKAAGESAKFLLVGAVDTESPDHIPEWQLREWHRQGSIRWLGFITDMVELLSGADIVCLPTSYGEGIPRVLIEAAAMARPIIATNVPGCNDIVRDGVNGTLIPVGDSEALAIAIKRLLDDEGLRLRMGQQGRTIVEREFSLSKVLAETFSTYDTLFSAIIEKR